MARRHLKVRAEHIQGSSMCKLSLLHQSHSKAEGIGPKGVKLPFECFISSGDFFSYVEGCERVTLYTICGDGFGLYDYRGDKSCPGLWLHLPATINPQAICEIKSELWPAIKAAVKAYNEWGETQ